MGARGSRRVSGRTPRKSKFSAQEKIDRGRVGQFTKKMSATGKVSKGEMERITRRGVSLVRERFVRNPVPRAGRNPVTARGGGAPRRRRG